MARQAGVSQSTVSLVFSGKGAGRVSRRTRSACGAARASSATCPTSRPRRCGSGSSRAVALLVPDITNPFFSRVLRGAQRAAQAAGFTVALVDTANDRRWEEQSFEALRAGPVDGYLLFEVSAPEALGPDQRVVLMEAEAPGRPSVRFDAEGGAAAAFEHLLELGHRRVGPPRGGFRRAHLPPARGRPAARARRAGARPRRPAARGHPDRDRRRPRRRRAAARRAPDRGALRRRPDRRRALPGRARARAADPPRPVGGGLRRHGLRPRARSAAHHGRARRRALGRHRVRAAREADGGHGVRAPGGAAGGAAGARSRPPLRRPHGRAALRRAARRAARRTRHCPASMPASIMPSRSSRVWKMEWVFTFVRPPRSSNVTVSTIT